MSDEKPSLSDLRIDDHARYGGSGRMGIWLLALLLVAASAAALWYWFRAPRAIPVRVAAVVEAGTNPGSSGAAVLNASGYVTARRRATVSSKMTGKVIAVVLLELCLQCCAAQGSGFRRSLFHLKTCRPPK